MSTVETGTATKFHLSLNVSQLERSVSFLEVLLGTPPAKLRHDYAKFELTDPPLVLSLEPSSPAGRGALNHVGFRLPDSAALVEAQRRLEAAGISTQREEGVECCYARQTKFWVNDPDGTLWEMYVLEDDIDHRGAGQAPEVIPPPATMVSQPSERVTAFHRLGQPFPESLPGGEQPAFEPQSVDEVLLQGTFNARLDAAERRRILAEVRRVLRPGGQVLVHVLTGASALRGAPKLPGPASVVEVVPVDRELLAELEAAGLVGIEMTKFGESPCFHYDGVELRETKVLAHAPAAGGQAPRGVVVYRGPFRELVDDAGVVFRRGERMAVDAATWKRLQAGPAAGQFLRFSSG